MNSCHTRAGLASLLAVLLTAVLPAGAQADRPSAPNIVVVLADDLGYGDLGCYGNKEVKTPNIDRFAKQGLRLTSCYAAGANCSPSRAALLTGRTPTRLGVHNWIPMLSPMHLRSSEITLPTLLRRAGYATALFGKWHLCGMFNLPGQPQPSDHGFDYWFATQNNALPNHRNPYNFVRNGIPVGPVKGFSAEIVAGEAIRWLHKRDKAKPFFLHVCFHEPHEPIATAERFTRLYSFADPSKRDYYGSVSQLDDGVGRLLQTLDDLGLRDNTIVFFTSDNGPAITAIHPHGSTGPLRAKKGHLYEGGIRVPGILRWPGKTKPGSTSDEPVSGVDVLPTLCAAVGIKPPKDRILDGSNVLPILEGKEVKRRRPLYWHFNAAQSKPKVALRLGDWMLLGHLDQPPRKPGADILPEEQRAIRTAKLTDFELYNLRADIGQKDDLVARRPDKLRELSAKLRPAYEEVRSESPLWPAWTWPRYEAKRIEWPAYWKPRPSRKKSDKPGR